MNGQRIVCVQLPVGRADHLRHRRALLQQNGSDGGQNQREEPLPLWRGSCCFHFRLPLYQFSPLHFHCLLCGNTEEHTNDTKGTFSCGGDGTRKQYALKSGRRRAPRGLSIYTDPKIMSRSIFKFTFQPVFRKGRQLQNENKNTDENIQNTNCHRQTNYGTQRKATDVCPIHL